MKLLSLAFIVMLISSCQALHSDDPSSLAFDIPKGSTLSLNKELTISKQYTHALLQAGKQISEKDRNEYDINCQLELKGFGPRTIKPETFSIRRTEDGQEWVSYPAIKRFYTELYLDSEKATDVIKLVCQEWGDGFDKNFTVTEMQQALGDFFTLSFANKNNPQQ